MSLRILHIMNRVPWPVKDGGTLACYNLLKGLSDAGCNVTLAAMNTSKHYLNEEDIPEALNRLADVRTAYIDNRVKPLHAFANLFTNSSYNISRFYTPQFEDVLKNTLHEKEFDIVIFDNLFTAPYVELVRSSSKALLVLRQHNVEYKIWQTLAVQTGNPLKKWYINLLSSRLKHFEEKQIHKFDSLITLTEEDKTEFERMGFCKPILVSPVGIEFKKEVLNAKPSVGSVFHLGAMDWQPNQQAMKWFVCEVWPKVVVRNPDAVFYMAGKKMPEEFRKYHGKSIKIEGEVGDAVAFMQSKQIMIVPLFAGSGIRVKILEGMAVGKAIITTSLGIQGIKHTPGKHAMIANSADEFCQCIELLLNNHLLCNALGEEARKLVEKEYSNTSVINKLLQFYKSINAHGQ